jgi:hypothetical protein
MKLTAAQLTAIAFLDCHDAAAMRHRGRWIWRGDILADPALTLAFVEDRSDGYRNSELLRAWLSPQRENAVRQ